MRDVSRVIRESCLLHGVLPLSSVCNVSCLFCSNGQNPPGVQTYHLSARPLDEVLRDISLLKSHERIIIGESATRINEGEPYTYEHIDTVIETVRRAVPGATLAVTTNGILLTQRNIDVLSAAGRVEVTVSLNAFCPDARYRLMRDTEPERVLRSVERLGRAGVLFHGSMVAMAHITGWDDFRQSVRFLAEQGAATVRVFIPGFTRMSNQVFPPSVMVRLKEEVASLSEDTRMPITLEPSRLSGTLSLVWGVIRNSHASRAGVKPGDVILEVDGVAPLTSLDAFRRVTQAASPLLLLKRGGDIHECVLRKPAGAASGIVMHRDIDPGRLRAIINRVLAHPGRCAIATASLAQEMWENTIKAQGLGEKCRVFVVKNQFFGGNISCAGLLTVSDFARTLSCPELARWNPSLVLLPAEPFDSEGRDLVGESWHILRDHYRPRAVEIT